ncbi:Bug family tripartite tricarboxylate transporter substrate binding protein [Variovorax saccharolyticus]|uniref:Bug family tripartite tricarboxylate transporter substrate binding protein n=1 Tax=Variovorax saccharolyticus TaxID=3053516 RepID=UPI002577BE3A|nr:tripartite tricarboxylate transporter substrate binding protein [Variovorax sp. J22R187]MDM0018816.1 tripartite tricarboxylate transporter substrate binding protein [Variovorax sp. J22R187]
MRHAAKLALVAAVVAIAGTGTGTARADDYPSKPVKIVVAYQAGQGTDVATRYIAEKLTAATGQTFFVENRGGAGGNIGTEMVARAAADGYTLTMGTNGTHVLNQFMYASTGFNAETGFDPIVLLGTFPMVLLAQSASPFVSLQEVLAAAKAGPKTADIGIPSTTARLVFEFLKEKTGSPLFGVPYKGSTAVLTDVLGGQLPLMIDTVTAVRPQVDAGKLKALAVTSAKRTSLLPNIPTVAEQGVPGFEVIAWNALYAPRGTPPAVIARLNSEVNKILAQPETKARFLELGFDIGGGTADDLGRFARAERTKWGPVIQKAGMRAD